MTRVASVVLSAYLVLGGGPVAGPAQAIEDSRFRIEPKLAQGASVALLESPPPFAPSVPSLIVSTVVMESYMLTYGFLWGVAMSASVIASGGSPQRANAYWIAATLGGGLLGWWASDRIVRLAAGAGR